MLSRRATRSSRISCSMPIVNGRTVSMSGAAFNSDQLLEACRQAAAPARWRVPLGRELSRLFGAGASFVAGAVLHGVGEEGVPLMAAKNDARHGPASSHGSRDLVRCSALA